jgi:hypothetical protein
VQDGAGAAVTAGVEDGEQLGAEVDDERLAFAAVGIAGQGLGEVAL